MSWSAASNSHWTAATSAAWQQQQQRRQPPAALAAVAVRLVGVLVGPGVLGALHCPPLGLLGHGRYVAGGVAAACAGVAACGGVGVSYYKCLGMPGVTLPVPWAAGSWQVIFLGKCCMMEGLDGSHISIFFCSTHHVRVWCACYRQAMKLPTPLAQQLGDNYSLCAVYVMQDTPVPGLCCKLMTCVSWPDALPAGQAVELPAGLL
jgi:hypothetical protein